MLSSYASSSNPLEKLIRNLDLNIWDNCLYVHWTGTSITRTQSVCTFWWLIILVHFCGAVFRNVNILLPVTEEHVIKLFGHRYDINAQHSQYFKLISQFNHQQYYSANLLKNGVQINLPEMRCQHSSHTGKLFHELRDQNLPEWIP